MQTIKLTCPSCCSEQLKKNGKTVNKKQRYLCKNCGKQFITDYNYNACKPWVKSLIVPMTLNSSGIRDISRVLKISTNTVLSTLKQAYAKLPEREKPEKVISVEVDE